MVNFLTFWKGDKKVPGVADAERRTKATQEQRGRKYERDNLLKLIEEGRLHEADAEQVEQIKLALELNEILNSKAPVVPGIDAEAIAEAFKGAVSELMASLPTVIHTSGGGGGGSAIDSSRPQMKHTSMTDISHKDSKLTISHSDTLTTEKEGDEDAAAKLKLLREIKASKT